MTKSVNDIIIDLHDLNWHVHIDSCINNGNILSGYRISIRNYSLSSANNAAIDDIHRIDVFASSATNLEEKMETALKLVLMFDNVDPYPVQGNTAIIGNADMPSYEHYDVSMKDINKAKNEWELADLMMHQGWRYSATLSNRGDIRRSSFDRWDWHGKQLGSPVSLWRMASMNADWLQISKKLAKASVEAWNDFPTSIPTMNLNGEVVVDKFKTSIVFKTNEGF
jgi:hypothetical protein